MRTRHRSWWVGLAALTVGCGAETGEKRPDGAEVEPTEIVEGVAGADGAAGSADVTPPGQRSGALPCVISADCPAGAHCDLGECVQACHAEKPCAAGYVCSPRARCLPPEVTDTDPGPVTEHQGSIAAEPRQRTLSVSDTVFEVQLRSTSKEPVSYRVEIDAPHLSLSSLRGEFTEETRLRFTVDGTRATGYDNPGTVRIVTSLGNVLVTAPLHASVTGRYRGVLRYDAAPVMLGDARVTVDVLERHGELMARIDPSESLLFPETEEGPATGFGRFVPGETVELTGTQRFEGSFGGSENLIGRAIGRRLTLRLEPIAGGALQGTFEESLHGLFGQPVTLTGLVTLLPVAGATVPEFTLSQDVGMPVAANAYLDATSLGWNSGCQATLRAECSDYNAPDATTATRLRCLERVRSLYSDPLYTALQSTTDLKALASECEASLTAGSRSAPKTCGLLAPVACAVNASSGLANAQRNNRLLSSLVERMVAPAVFVAQEHLIEGLDASFERRGVQAELEHYEDATTALVPVMRWVLQAPVLEALRTLPLEDARATAPASQHTFPAAHALGRLLQVLAVAQAERARLSAADLELERDERVRAAQERAVLAHLGAASLVAMLREWGEVPPELATGLTGMLTPLDAAFGAALRGAGAFGLPENFVPFVYDERYVTRGATNFEQMLSLAAVAEENYATLEASYLENKRMFDLNEDALRDELLQLEASYDARLTALCGPAFDPDAEDPIAGCASSSTGEVGLTQFAIERAQKTMESIVDRMADAKAKIEIDERLLAAKLHLREKTLEFITANGEALKVVAKAEARLAANKEGLSAIGSFHPSNYGLSTVAGAYNARLQGTNGVELAARRQELLTAQTLRFEADALAHEQLEGVANIQKQFIDLTQLDVEFELERISLGEALARQGAALQEVENVLRLRAMALQNQASTPLRDPLYRVLRDQRAVQLLEARRGAQEQLFLAARALEYEVNTPIEGIVGAVLNARSQTSMKLLHGCFDEIYGRYRTTYGPANPYPTVISVRKLLGITGSRTDEVTGEELSAGELFRRALLKNANLDGRGGVTLDFSTNLQPGNQLWSTDLCADRITTVRAQLVGDFQGDDDAQVQLSLSGTSVTRDCGAQDLRTWSLADGPGSFAVIQAGVNGYGRAPANTSLFGQSVARASWKLVIPGPAAAPSNADLELTKLEDIVLEVEHLARPLQSTPLSVNLSCLGAVR